MKKHHLLVISIDALNAKDLSYIQTLPNFRSIIQEGSLVKSIEPSYPSMTYCCHTSIITGTSPKQHGIYNNTIMNPYKLDIEQWHWFKSAIKVPTLFDLAKEAGLKTSAILWPVMAGANIDYNVPEIWSDEGESSFKLFLKHGSKKLLPLVIKHQHLLDGKNQPGVDNFSEAISLDILRKKKPELMCIHYTELDSTRHTHGIFNDTTRLILNKMDLRIGKLINLLKTTEQYDNTTIILLGDHGGTDVTHIVSINQLFFDAGLITLAADDTSIVEWSAFANTCGGSVQIHLKNPEDSLVKQKVETILTKLCNMPNTPIKEFYTKDKVLEKFQLSGPFSYMLEGKDGYIFKNALLGKVILERDKLPNVYKGEHGFLPSHENLRTLFMIKGKGIKKGHSIDQCQLFDEGPTMAKILGLQFPDTIDGNLLDVFE